MFYRICLALALGIVVVSLIGAMSSNASTLSVRQQNFVDERAQRRSRAAYIVPVPYGAYGGRYGGGGSGSSRSSYDGYRGGGPGAGK